MKSITLLAMLVSLLVACKKVPQQNPTPIPAVGMDTTNFNNREIVFRKNISADLNHDGIKDFYVQTLHVGDALLQREYKQFRLGTNLGTDFPINQNEEIPILPKGHVIAHNSFYNYNWYEVASIVVAQKVITSDRSWWEGIWKDQFQQYVPLRIHKNGKIYYGWVELSFDSLNEKLILHRAAVSKDPDVQVSAGN